MKQKKTKSKPAIILAAGGTGGHFFPAIALSEQLLKQQYKILLLTDTRCQKYLPSPPLINTHIIDLHINMSNIINKIQSIYKLAIACIKAIFFFTRSRPKIVVGFGGYPSVPAMVAARILAIPLIIQEQNCVFGRSNLIFAHYAKYIAVSYNKIQNLDNKYNHKIIHTGPIIRQSINQLPKKKFNYNNDTFNLFIVGGSQGSNFLSQVVPEIIKIVAAKIKSSTKKLKIIQQASNQNAGTISTIYNSLNIEHHIAPFFKNINEIYTLSDLVITRSGAGVISELVNIGLPAIFIPYPYAKDNHQMLNAEQLANNRASWCYNQLELKPELLANKLYQLILNPYLLEQASNNMLSSKINNIELLLDKIYEVIR